MTMPRSSVLSRMQNQRSPRKRSATGGPPSPKRLRRGAPGLTVTHSPISSPQKGLFIDSDTDSPTFMTKSFYGDRKRAATVAAQNQLKSNLLTPSSISPPASMTQTCSIFAENTTPGPVAKTCPRRLRSALTKRKASVEPENMQAKTPRVAFSPVKNSSCNSMPQEENSGKAAVIRRCHASLPANVHCAAPKHILSTPAKEKEDSSNSEVSTPISGRRFFKYKSPVSASKAIGGIVIGKGFNLKFVPHKLSNKFKKSSQKSTEKRKSAPRVRKTYSRTSPIIGSDYSKSAVKENGNCGTLSEYSDAGSVSSLTDHQHSQATQQSSTQETAASKHSDDESVMSASHSDSLFSSDMQSLVSDTSSLAEITPTRSHDSQSLTLPGERKEGWPENKLSPIFSQKRQSQRLAAQRPNTPSPKPKFIDKNCSKQLVLDAGQKKYGMTQCHMCGMVYAPADPADEATHAKFHQSTLTALKFPGWKKERVVNEFLDDGSRVICVLPEDPNFMTKKVEEVNYVMTQELGCPDQVFTFRPTFKAFFYLSDDKRIKGCCIAESIKEGYRVLPNESSDIPESQRPWFCSKVPEPASLGIGRLWVYGPSRGHGIATRLVDCVRQWFEYGIVINKSHIAFSDPTPEGRRFAAKYTGTQTFLVYKYIP